MPEPIRPLAHADSPPLRELVGRLGLRLDDEEIRAIETALQDVDAPVYLFGSRVDRHRRGGDIDLLVLADAPAFETSQRIATRFFSQCEEKIDVIVMNPDRLTPAQQAFLDSLQKVRIH
jgi:uncharacterized protein